MFECSAREFESLFGNPITNESKRIVDVIALRKMYRNRLVLENFSVF